MPRQSKALKKVNPRTKKFVREYVKSGNLTDAMATAYPKMKRTTASAHASKMIKRPEVQQDIKQALDKSGITLSDLMDRKREMVAQGGEQLEGQRISPELYNKTLDGLIELYNTSRQGIKTSLNINIDTATTPQLLKKRGEYSTFFKGILDGEVLDGEEQ